MDPLNALVQEAIAAVKAGRKQEARDKLLSVIEQNERHEQAWLGLSALVESVEEQRICLENVLAINPANERAQKALAKLGGQSAPPPVAPTPPPSTPARPAPTPSPTASASDPFGDSEYRSFNSPPAMNDQRGSSSPHVSPFGDISFDGFGASGRVSRGAGQADVFDTGAYHGSGQATELPSAEEYDQWMTQLNLNTASDLSSLGESESSAGSSPFSGGDAFGSGLLPWEEEAQHETFGAPESPWMAGESPFEAEEDDSPPYLDPSPRAGRGRETQADRYAAPSPTSPSTLGTSFDFGRPPASMATEHEESESFDFEFDDDDANVTISPFEVDSGAAGSWLGQSAATAARAAVPLSASAPKTAAGGASAEKYYSQIPADIEAVPRGTPRQRMLLVIGLLVLLVLNAASIGLLVATL